LKKRQKPSKQQSYEQIGKMIENIYLSGYIDKNQMYKTSFLKGLVTGLGGVLGATIVVGLLLWVLSFFNRVPLIGPITEQIKETVQTQE
jgi:hypothetical protein